MSVTGEFQRYLASTVEHLGKEPGGADRPPSSAAARMKIQLDDALRAGRSSNRDFRRIARPTEAAHLDAHLLAEKFRDGGPLSLVVIEIDSRREGGRRGREGTGPEARHDDFFDGFRVG